MAGRETPATRAARAADIAFEVHEYTHDPAAPSFVLGISPLGQRRRLPTLVDDSAAAFETVHISGGRRGLEIELTPAGLVALTGAEVRRLRR